MSNVQNMRFISTTNCNVCLKITFVLVPVKYNFKTRFSPQKKSPVPLDVCGELAVGQNDITFL